MRSDRTLVDIVLPDLEILLRALVTGKVQRLDPAALQSLALGHLAGCLGPLEGAQAEIALPALKVLIAERRHRRGAHIELVWTGPEAGLRPARDTAVVVRELFGRAQSRVLVGGFRFDHGAEILRPLHRGMAERGVEASLFLDIPRAPRDKDPERHASDFIARFFLDNWPFGPPRPELYYDPRTITHHSLASLHAKCLVVDGRWALVSSANFTDRGLSRNVEAGALIDEPTFASRLTEQWLGLVDSGQMQPYRPA
jgi:phosphatidylserine/phosphatidylglycerophosphate/cardiolipin synthase-like enzyme